MSAVKVILRGQKLTLDDGLLLGQGGEARVFRHPSEPRALKVFHDIEPHLPARERALRERIAALRVEKLAMLVPQRLPLGVVGPDDVLTLMEKLNKELKKTIFMVTHNANAAERASVQRKLDKGALQ